MVFTVGLNNNNARFKASFQVNLDNPVLECGAIQDFNTATRYDAAASSDNWNSKMCKAPIK